MKEGFIETKNGKVWYCVCVSDRQSVPLLVVHGGPGFVSMPQVIEEFSDERDVYFYDQMGSGKSDRPSSNDFYSVENFINELEEVIKKLELKQVILMGFSWGCALICKYILEKKPENIKGIILSAPYLSSPRWYADQRENIMNMPENTKKAILKGEETQNYGDEYQKAIMEYYIKHVCRLDPWPDYVQQAFGRLNMDAYLTMWGPSEFTITGSLKEFDLISELRSIDIPVLLTCGDYDEADVKTVRDYQRAFKDASLAVIPMSSHLHQIEQPHVYKAVVRSFLKKICGSGR
jgi:proline iminopeptidase